MKLNKKKHYLLYSLIFTLFVAFIVFEYYSKGKSIINYGGDGYRQHFRGLVYVSNWLKKILRNIFIKHVFEIPQWGYSIAEGSDIINTFHYYGLGDPINIFSVFIPENYLYLLYDFSIFLRMYLSGLFFSELCFYENKKGLGVLAGALIYCFSSFSILSAIGHIYFLNGVMYLPFVIYGIEKIIKEDNGILLTISVALSSLSSIYFFYMIVLLAIIFALVRVIILQISTKEKLNKLLKMLGYSFIGLMISAIIFVPEVYSMLSNSRLSYEIQSSLFYDLSEYIGMFNRFVYGEGYFGGYSILAVFAILTLFLTKNNRTLKALSIICLLLISFPFFGKMFNAFTYTTDRWLFAIVLFISYVVASTFDDITENIKNRKIIYLLSIIVFLLPVLITNENNWKVYFIIFAYGIFVFACICLIKKEYITKILLVSICLLNITSTLFFKFSTKYWNYGRNGTDIELVKNIGNGECNSLPIDGNSYYRYSGDSLVTNDCVHGDVSSTGYYWSVANNNVVEFRTDIGLSDRNNHHYDDYDDSFILNSLASVKYYIKKENDIVPYEYNQISSTNEFDVYESKNVLPIIYGYNSCINEEKWKELSLIDKQIALTENAVINCNRNVSNKYDYEILNYDLSIGGGIEQINNGFNIKESNSSITINVKGDIQGEYYLVANNFDLSTSSYINVSLYNGTNKQLIFKEKGTPEYCGKHNFAINLGYLNSIDGNIEITFPDKAIATYDSIQIICLPLNEVENNIKELNCIDIIDYKKETNRFDLNVDLKEDKFVCISMPYCQGWKACVDGKEVDIQRTNIMYMGFQINKGTHLIEFKYSTPLLLEGSIISIMGLVIFSFVIIRKKKRTTV